MIIMTMLKLWKLNQFLKCMLNLLFSWKCEHKCVLEDFQAFIISCICVEAYHFFYFNDIYTNYVMESLNIFYIKASLASRSRVPGPAF